MDLFGAPEAAAENVPEPPVLDDGGTAEEAFLPSHLVQILQGFERQEEHLLKLYNDDRLPHGLIFTGVKGIGKAGFAYRLARFLLKHGAGDAAQDDMFGAPEPPSNMDVSPEETVSRYIAQGAHPELLSIQAEKDLVNVEAVRKIAPFLRMTASNDGWRVVIIDDADRMNRAAQNALLKVLEEPPKRTMVILVCHRLGAMIPTIRSRAQLMVFDPPSYGAFEAILRGGGYALEDEQLGLLFALSGGSIGKALGYIEQGGLDILAKILGAFHEWPKVDLVAIHALSEDFARAGESYPLFAEILQWLIEKICKAKARGAQLDGDIWQQPIFRQIMTDVPLNTLLDVQSRLNAHFLKVERANLDKRTGVLQAFSIVCSLNP